MMSSKRIFALLLAVVLCVCVFCGCAQKEPAKEQQGVTEEKKEEKTEVVKTSKPDASVEGNDAIITVAIDGEPPHLNLAQSLDFYAVWVTKNINDFLVVYDTDMNVQLSMAKKTGPH